MHRTTPPTLRVLSWGGGQDSTTALLMSAHGELPRLDATIFSDTQNEPRAVYETLEWVTAAVGIPIYRVSVGNLGNAVVATARQHAQWLQEHGGDSPTTPSELEELRQQSEWLKERGMLGSAKRLSAGHIGQPPFWVRNDPHKNYATAVSGGALWRKCTHDYKIVPIRRKIRELLGVKPTGRLPNGMWVEQWIGFPKDELARTFCSDVQWITNTFPLILPMRMTKRDCARWLTEHGYPIPAKSSCTFCPYHSNAYWREMRDHRPDEWAATVAFERQLHAGKLPGVRGIPYLHRSMVPLHMAVIDEENKEESLFCYHCDT